MIRRLAIAVATALLLAGCGSDTTRQAGSADDGASALLEQHGLAGRSVTQVIDELDRLPLAERPADLMASVRVDRLVLTDGDAEHTLEIPRDSFYLSVAPYEDQTHECFYHSLTTCKGELSAEPVQVQIKDSDGEVLVDGEHRTFDNGFVGFWLPRGIEGTIRISHDGKVSQTAFSTDDEAPTCLTTMRLA